MAKLGPLHCPSRVDIGLGRCLGQSVHCTVLYADWISLTYRVLRNNTGYVAWNSKWQNNYIEALFKDVVGNDNISVCMRIPQEETKCKTRNNIQLKYNWMAALLMFPHVPSNFTILGLSMVKYHLKKENSELEKRWKQIQWKENNAETLCVANQNNTVTYLLFESVNNINVCSLWLLSLTEFLIVPQISLPVS